MSEQQSIFEQYAPKSSPKLEVVETRPAKPGKHIYKAYGVDKPRSKSRLYIEHNDADQTVNTMAKGYLVQITYSARRYLALIFTTVVFLMEGENLDPLVELLNDEEVKSLHRFNPKLHEKPAAGEPVITRIRLAALREVQMLSDAAETPEEETI